jgi:hypothetical protein
VVTTLSKTLGVVNEMQREGIIGEYAIGGAIAAFYYLEPAATFGVDIFISLEPKAGELLSLAPIYEYLRTRGYREKEETVAIENWDVHFIPACNPLVKEALSAATAIDLDGIATRILPAEYLMAIALQTGRSKDLAPNSISGSRRCGPRPLQRNFATPRSGGELANLSSEVSAQSTMNKTVQRIFDRKAERRRELAALPFAKKIEIVEQLRELGRAMKKSRTQVRAARR